MDGDQKPQAPNGPQEKPADNPPSLSEPTARKAVIPPITAPVTVPAQPTVATGVPFASTNGSLVERPAADEVQGSSFYHAEETIQDPYAQATDIPVVAWTSSGEELQSTTAAWRVRMSVVSVVAGALIFAVTRDFLSSGAVVIVGLLFAFMGARRPPSLKYQLTNQGIIINDKQYLYNHFRAFSVAEDSRAVSIGLVPLKRFAPILSVYCSQEQHDQVVATLADHLPMEMRRSDAFDQIINRIKF